MADDRGVKKNDFSTIFFLDLFFRLFCLNYNIILP